jgi:hypothetical protein
MSKTLLIFALLALAGCSNPEGATKALRGAGYTDIKLTGYRWIGCSKDDHYADGFEAKGPTGVPVTGVVCSGLMFKGSTIRLD